MTQTETPPADRLPAGGLPAERPAQVPVPLGAMAVIVFLGLLAACLLAASSTSTEPAASGWSYDQVPVRATDPEVVLADMDVRLEGYAGSRRARFAGVYATMTAGTRDRIDAGFFADGEWTETLLLRFVDYWTVADDDLAVAVPWAYAYASADEPGSGGLGDVLLGMNAHINHDLVFATSDLLYAEAMAHPEPSDAVVDEVAASRHGDFERIDQVIADLVGAAVEHLEGADGPLESAVRSHPDHSRRWADAIAAWRADAWDAAVELTRARVAGQDTDAMVAVIEQRSLRWAQMITSATSAVEPGSRIAPGLVDEVLARTELVVSSGRVLDRAGLGALAPVVP